MFFAKPPFLVLCLYYAIAFGKGKRKKVCRFNQKLKQERNRKKLRSYLNFYCSCYLFTIDSTALINCLTCFDGSNEYIIP